jgi:hypothetical protein
VLLTPFRVASLTGYPPYAGVVSLWWLSRAPTDSDALIADLMVNYAVVLVDRERLTAERGRAEAHTRAARLASCDDSSRRPTNRPPSIARS